MSSLKNITIPASVATVESQFIENINPSSIVFCGLNDPTMIAISNIDIFIGGKYTGKVIVSLDYKGTSFAKRDIIRSSITCESSSPNKKKICICCTRNIRSSFVNSNFLYVFLLSVT